MPWRKVDFPEFLSFCQGVTVVMGDWCYGLPGSRGILEGAAYDLSDDRMVAVASSWQKVRYLEDSYLDPNEPEYFIWEGEVP